MAIVAADWDITRSTKVIDYIGTDHGTAGASYATVIQFRRWLGDLADDASSSGDDELDITDVAPAVRSTDNIITLINGYTITDAAAEHLFDGSIIQSGGDDIWDGIVNFGNEGVAIQIHQNGSVIADDWWNSVPDGESVGGLNRDVAAGISHRFMIKVRDSGTDTDGRRLLGQCRTFGNTYSEFPINGTSRGNNVLALSDTSDLNNETLVGTVATWTTIDNSTEGYANLDIDNDSTDEYYYAEWNKATYTINQFYERMKWLTRDGTASTLYGLNGELFRGITHEVSLTTPRTGTFSAFEAVSWGAGATAGTGQMFAIDSVSTGTKMWIQLLSGVAPSSSVTITGGGSSATATNTGTPTSRSVSTPFIGASTGSSIIGAYGVGIEATDLSSSDKVFDLDNSQVTPPNYVTFTVGGLVSTEDRLLVAPWDGVSTDVNGDPAIEVDQLDLNGGLTGGAITSVVVTGSIPSDTPSTGTIRIERDSGKYTRHPYSTWSGSTFTITSHDFSTDNASNANNVYISYIDDLAGGTSENFTGVYSADRDLVVIARDGGGTPIKEFITSAVLGSSGGSSTVIRTSDE